MWSDLSCPLSFQGRGIHRSGDPNEAVRLINAWAERVMNSLIDFPVRPDSVSSLNRVVLGHAHPGFLHEHLPHKEVKGGMLRVPFHSNVAGILAKLGLRLSFDEMADLSNMTEDVDSGFQLVLSDIIHKTDVEANEVGTGGSDHGRRWISSLTIPFPYFSLEETGLIIFAGHVLSNPLKSSIIVHYRV